MIRVELVDAASHLQRGEELLVECVPRIGETIIHGPQAQRWKVVDVVWRSDASPVEVHARKQGGSA